jgi:hypothetical protein
MAVGTTDGDERNAGTLMPHEEEVEDGGATGIEIKDDGNGSARKGAERIGENKEWQKSFEYFVGRA